MWLGCLLLRKWELIPIASICYAVLIYMIDEMRTAWILIFSIFVLGDSGLKATLQKNRWMDFYEIFGIARSPHKNNLEHLGDIVINFLGSVFFLSFGSVLISNITWKAGNKIFMKFSAYIRHNKNNGLKLSHTWLDNFTPFRLTLAECLLAKLWKNGWANFHNFFRIYRIWQEVQCAHFSDACMQLLECIISFIFCLFSNITEKRVNRFSSKF